MALKAKARHGGPVAFVQLCILPSAERVSIRGESLLVILVILVIFWLFWLSHVRAIRLTTACFVCLQDRRAPDNGLSASPFNPSRGRWSDAAAELERCPAIYERSTKGRARVGKTTQEGAELATRVNQDEADGSELKKHGGSKTGWVGKILEPGVNNSDDSDDDDSDDDAPGMTPEDLGMTEGGGKGRAKASHHVTWLIASTSTEAQVSLFSSP